MSSNPSKRLLIAGYYGFGNTGDEAILAGMLHDLRALEVALQVTVVSGNPEETIRVHRTDSVYWKDIQGIIRAGERSDLILVGGGGLFHDYWPSDSKDVLTPDYSGLSFFESFPTLANLVEIPCVAYAVGVGPLRTSSGREQARRVFDGCELVTVRDRQSLELTQALGVREDLELRLSADPAFNAPISDPQSADTLLKSLDFEPGTPIYGVALRYWDFEADPERWEAELSVALNQFLEGQESGKLLFLPFQCESSSAYENDLAVCRRVWRRLNQPERAEILDQLPESSLMASVVARCEFIVAMRLHAAIFALNASVPVINMAYDPKTSVLMQEAALGDFVASPSSWDSRTLLTLIDRAYAERSTLRRQINGFGAKMRDQAQVSASIVETLLTSADMDRHSTQPAIARDFALERNDQVIELRRRLIATNAALFELEAIKSGKGWAFLRMLWRFRVLIAPPDSSQEQLLKRLQHAANPTRVLRFLNRLGLPRRMSWEAYAFDRFKRARRKLSGASSLRSLRWPTKSGLVSVVLPAYNEAQLIGDSVESLLAQRYKNWELIAVNDGSTDATGEVLEGYADQDSRITVIHQDNQRIPKSLTRGFQAAHGEYLTWTSADNRMKDDFLDRAVNSLRRHPDWDMVYANMDIIGDDGQPLNESEWFADYQTPAGSEHVHLPEDPSALNVWPNNYIGGAFLYRDRVEGLIGRFSPLRFTTEDYDYWMRVNALMNLRHADFRQPVYDYRFHAKSLTSRDEQLGITRDRVKLMVFEDFRRDFYLSPLAWWVELETGGRSQLVSDYIRRFAEAAGHLWFEGENPDDKSYAGLWLPKVYLQVVVDLAEQARVPSWAPADALKVLVVASDDSARLPKKLEGAWNLALVASRMDDPPRLASGSDGWVSTSSLAELFTALDIRARQHHLELIENELERPEVAKPKISVVVPTFRRGSSLKNCLEALAGQNFPGRDFEIVVVNNDPTDKTVETIASQFRQQLPQDRQDHVRVAVCPVPGLSHARNAGISEARGEVVCFVDDDVVVEQGWMAWIWEAFESHPGVGAVGGTIAVRIPDPRPRWIKVGMEEYWSHFAPGYTEYTEVKNWWQYPWGANWSARRRALLEIGGFRTRYGRQGEGYAGGEEIVAASLIRQLGYSVAIEPRAIAHHRVDSDRFTRWHAFQSILNGRRTWYRAQRDLYLPWEFGLLGAMRRAIGGTLGIPAKALSRSPLVAVAEAVGDYLVLIWRLRDTIGRLRTPIALGR